MSENSEGTESPGEPTQPEGGNSGFTPPASQEEFNQIIEKRLERERAKFGDYDDLKAKAAKLSEIEESNKSEIEKAQEKASQAEAELAKMPEKVADSLRNHLITIHEISDEDAELFLTASDPDVLLKQAERLVDRGNHPPKTGLHVPREGGNGGGNSSTADLFAAAVKDQL